MSGAIFTTKRRRMISGVISESTLFNYLPQEFRSVNANGLPMAASADVTSQETYRRLKLQRGSDGVRLTG